MTRQARFLVGGLLVALLLAALVSFYASGSPDGLNKVAIDTGFADSETDHRMADGPLAGYGTAGVENERLSTAIAGASGVLITLVIGGGLFVLLRRRSDDRSDNRERTAQRDQTD